MQMRHLAFRQGEHLHVGIGHALEDARDVFLIAGEAVHRFGQDQVETAAHCVGHERLNAWADQRGAGDRVVRILLDDMPALLLGMETAHTELVGDGGVALIVGRIAGVDRDFQNLAPVRIRRSASSFAVTSSLPLHSTPAPPASPGCRPDAEGEGRDCHAA
ncbi:hypothetical protein ADZ37_22580 [Pannonibacter phragmitetus]|nr:hypothetical protein ADZ37_22580 [Pannonibacter phragmitetus]